LSGEVLQPERRDHSLCEVSVLMLDLSAQARDGGRYPSGTLPVPGFDNYPDIASRGVYADALRQSFGCGRALFIQLANEAFKVRVELTARRLRACGRYQHCQREG
jgi:hypothetical protein